ncbi:Protein kinase domain-containing protein [Nostoc sp. DSM 114161]|jgi:serine/threonine protein kinase|uniref:GUN4 domain-containing protein n=1 Tax=Nostoc sp. DSM 114161 TaxID=3440143 RepID=UPI004045E918
MYWNKGHQLHNGKYIIEDELGQGAFGITYKAIHSRINLPVVIKTPNMRLKKDREYPRYVNKFIQEAELLGQLCQVPHPNIVRVIDYFEEGDSNTPCLVMEFIAGKNLIDLIEGEVITPLPETEAIKYICQIGDALTSMHQNSIVHRDIHPGNIMLRSGNQPILIDFGLAGDIAPATSFSRSFGNKNFAPYEQMMGSKDITVDVYGLAATLYYVVTGEYPANSWDRKYHQANLIEPKQHNSSISQQLNLAIIQGMSLEANERPKSIQAWLSLLLVDQNTSDDLSSEVGIDYIKLRDYLAVGNWEQADYETYLVIIQAVGRQEGDWIRDEELLNFPCKDLRTIDRLWVKYSNGRFGFSVQKEIYLSVGGKLDGKYYREAWEKFGDRVGWRRNSNWIHHTKVTFDPSATPGYLPIALFYYRYYVMDGMVFVFRCDVLFSRIETCKV